MLTASCIDHLLQNCSSGRQAKQLHAQLLLHFSDTFLHSSAFVFVRLISVYSRFNLLSDALSVFRSTPQPHNSLLWNSILRANLSHDCPREALCIYSRMRSVAAAIPDCFTYPLAIRAAEGDLCACRSVHGQTVVAGFHKHLHVGNELVVMYGKSSQMELARKVFDGMPLRNIVSWNTLLSGFSLNCDCERALGTFRQMEVLGPSPNSVTWTSLLSAHARCGKHENVILLFDEMRAKGVAPTPEGVAVALSVCPYVRDTPLVKGEKIHGYVVKCGFQGYSFVRNSLICIYGKLGSTEDSEVLFTETKDKTLVSWNALISSYAAAGLCNEAYDVFAQLEREGKTAPDLVSWSAVIGGFATQGMVEQSLELFQRMLRVGIMPNCITIVTALMACAALSSLRLGKEIHGHTIRLLTDRNILVGNGLINMYTKSGSVRYGHRVFDTIKNKDLVTWNSMITGYGMHGLCNSALDTFNNMIQDGVVPDEITFVSLLSACVHAGRVSEGRKLFDQMVNKYNISPWVEHYACMVDLLARAGLLKEANDLIENMPMKPNACVWGALLNSCRVHGNTAMAEDSAAKAFGLETEATGNYMLLSNIYAALGLWEDSRKVRATTKAKGLKKNPGHSWIEVKKNVHVFSSGSASPIGAEGLEVLDSLNSIMEIDTVAPEQTLSFHSLDKKRVLTASSSSDSSWLYSESRFFSLLF